MRKIDPTWQTLKNNAIDYVNAAIILIKNTHETFITKDGYTIFKVESNLENNGIIKPILFLLGVALENICKAELVKGGMTINEVKNKYGHDLINLIKDVQNKGKTSFPIGNEVLQGYYKSWNLVYFNEYFVKYYTKDTLMDLKYPSPGSKEYAWPGFILEIVIWYIINFDNIRNSTLANGIYHINMWAPDRVACYFDSLTERQLVKILNEIPRQN